jgi:hypothetical protein
MKAQSPPEALSLAMALARRIPLETLKFTLSSCITAIVEYDSIHNALLHLLSDKKGHVHKLVILAIFIRV